MRGNALRRNNVLILTGSFYPAQEGGPTITMYWLAAGLAKIGYSVRVLASTKGLNNKYPADQWVPMMGFDVLYRSPSISKRILYQEYASCDCVITSGVCHIITHLRIFFLILMGKRVVLSPRGELFKPAIFHKGVLYGCFKVFFFRLLGVLYGNKITYHATSTEECNQIHHLMGKRRIVATIPNYMILPERIPSEKVSGNYDYLLYVGRIAPIKALDKLVEALSLSHEFMSGKVLLQVVGDNIGDYYEHLCRLVAEKKMTDRVVFRGVLLGEKKEECIANAKYLVLVSDSENFGNVVIESLAQGTPIVASFGTPWQVIEKNNAGFWVSNNPVILAKTIDRILTIGNDDYMQQRCNALKLAKSFDVFNNIEVWSKVIES